MSTALVNPRLLRWTRERAGIAPGAMAERMGTAEARLLEWESGAEAPTFVQAAKWANVTHQPFGYLYLSEPPTEVVSLPDLRVLDGRPPAAADPEFRALLQDIDFKAEWYGEYRREAGIGPFDFVGSLRGATALTVATKMRQALNPSPSDAGGPDEYMRQLVASAEDVGIWVMRTSVVGNNNARPIDVSTCRGFAVADPITPRVFVNSRDAKAAQVFTLIHELAHIWIGSSGVDDPFEAHSSPAEAVCNEAAAEFLMPEVDLRRFWAAYRAMDPVEHVGDVAAHYKVSRLAAALRCLNLGLVARDTYSEVRAMTQVSLPRTEPGGNFYYTLRARNGTRFVDAVVSSTIRGRTTYRDAASLLRVKPRVVGSMAEQVMGSRR